MFKNSLHEHRLHQRDKFSALGRESCQCCWKRRCSARRYLANILKMVCPGLWPFTQAFAKEDIRCCMSSPIKHHRSLGFKCFTSSAVCCMKWAFWVMLNSFSVKKCSAIRVNKSSMDVTPCSIRAACSSGKLVSSLLAISCSSTCAFNFKYKRMSRWTPNCGR